MVCGYILIFTQFRVLRTVSLPYTSQKMVVDNNAILGLNHSGKDGQVNWMMGLMGLANAQRSLSYIRILTEFISQPEYRDVVPLFGIVNEALVSDIGFDIIESLCVPYQARRETL